jgi:uncharacterized protein YdeI (YjbR/CyaY-like superfamily)
MAESDWEQVYPGTRQAWRDWLAEHHTQTAPIWLVYDKVSAGNCRLTYEEAVEEALCFGWIDSKVNRLDETRFKQMFSPRKPSSTWSKVNKRRVENLIAQGLMMPPGLAKIELAKQNGTWTVLDAIEELMVPPDLADALAANPTAQSYFEKFSPSSKKIILYWIQSAKRPETREKRIAETVRLAEQNIKANQPQR